MAQSILETLNKFGERILQDLGNPVDFADARSAQTQLEVPVASNPKWSDVSDDGNLPEDGANKREIFAQNSAPVSKYKEGDLWFDTDDSNTIYRANAALEWVSVKDGSIAGKTTTFRQAAIPTSLAAGDIWFDSDDGDKQYRAAAAGATTIGAGAWVRVDVGANPTLIDALQTTNAPAEAAATVGANWNTNLTNKPSALYQTFYQATAPATGMSSGDYWVDSDDNKLYRYNGASWVEIQDDQIATAITNAATAQSTADTKIVTFVQTTAPTAQETGDLWMDTDDNNHLYRWSGSAWVDYVQDYATWSKIAGTGKPEDSATKNTITRSASSSPPSTPGTGDLWYQTDTYNLYKYNGASWDLIGNNFTNTNQLTDGAGLGNTALWSGITGAGKAADNATVNVIFAQTSAPTALATGDIWFDTDDTNKPYRWSGAAWVAVNFADIGATVGAVTGTNLKDSGAVVLADIHVKNIRTVTYKEAVTAGQAISVSDGNAVADNPQTTGANASDLVKSTDYVAKKFTTTSAATAISHVKFVIYNSAGGANSGNIIVSIRASDGTDPTGSDIDGRTVNVAYTLDAFTESAVLTGTFATPPAVSGSTEYFVILTQDGTDAIKINSNTTAVAGDRKSADSGSTWSASTSNYQYRITPYETGMAAGEYRLASAKDTDFRYSGFIGITLETKSANQTGKLLFIGMSDVQSSLTAGLPYYLGDTNGSVVNPAGTNSKKIGLAFSATELLILNT